MPAIPTGNYKGNNDPRQHCPTCLGEGNYEVITNWGCSYASEPAYGLRDCEDCHGSGVAECEECHDDALECHTQRLGQDKHGRDIYTFACSTECLAVMGFVEDDDGAREDWEYEREKERRMFGEGR